MKSKRIKNIRNHTADAIEKVHAWTFILFEALVYIGFDRIVLSKILPDSVWAEIIRSIAFAGGYIFIYLFVKFIFEKIKHGKLPLDGKWYHVHIPDNSLVEKQEGIGKLSAGITMVSRNLNDFTFKSRNYRYTVDTNGCLRVVKTNGDHCTEIEDETFYDIDENDGKKIKITLAPNTTWCTETSELYDGNEWDVVEVYKATSTGEQAIKIQKCPVCGRGYSTPKPIEEAPKYRYGIHLYELSDNERQVICTYSDCWPSLKAGKLYLFRDRNERDAKIKEFFREHPLS